MQNDDIAAGGELWQREALMVLQEDCITDWLRGSLITALQRDPVDAANDAERLAGILGKRADSLVEKMAALVPFCSAVSEVEQ